MAKLLYSNLLVIVEIAGHAQGKNYPRWESARAALREASIGDCSVVSVAIEQGEEATIVPGFGHDFRCKGENHVCDIQPYSVHRYFGWHVTVEGLTRLEMLGRYKLTEYAQLEVTGICEPYEAGTLVLQRATRERATRIREARPA
jgi:hypothetical protein